MCRETCSLQYFWKQRRFHDKSSEFSAEDTNEQFIAAQAAICVTERMLGDAAQVCSQLKHLQHDRTALRCNALPLTSSDLIHMSFSQPPLRSTFSYGFVRWLFGTRPSATCFVVCLRPRMRAAPLCTSGYQSNQSRRRLVLF